ncbi:hypothetical protein PFISCL1PPCAC_12561, partial [Pristionchus fissidentatus]
NAVFMKIELLTRYIKPLSLNISYEQVAGGCGGHIEGAMGEIASPQYPHESIDNYDCIWRITVPPGNGIELTIEQFDSGLEESVANCDANSTQSRIDIYASDSILPMHKVETFCLSGAKETVWYTQNTI